MAAQNSKKTRERKPIQ